VARERSRGHGGSGFRARPRPASPESSVAGPGSRGHGPGTNRRYRPAAPGASVSSVASGSSDRLPLVSTRIGRPSPSSSRWCSGVYGRKSPNAAVQGRGPCGLRSHDAVRQPRPAVRTLVPPALHQHDRASRRRRAAPPPVADISACARAASTSRTITANGLAQRCLRSRSRAHSRGIGRVAGEVVAAETLDRHDSAGPQIRQGGCQRRFPMCRRAASPDAGRRAAARSRGTRPARRLPLPVHQLHQLRAAGDDHRRAALRPGQDLDARFPAVAPRASRSTATRRTAASTPSRSRAPTAGAQLSYRRPGDAARRHIGNGAGQPPGGSAGRQNRGDQGSRRLPTSHCDATDPAAGGPAPGPQARWAKPFRGDGAGRGGGTGAGRDVGHGGGAARLAGSPDRCWWSAGGTSVRTAAAVGGRRRDWRSPHGPRP